MLFFLLIFFFLTSIYSQTIKQLNEISIKEELPIGSIITFLTDKIPNLEQSLEYDLVTPLSSNLDIFSIDNKRHTLILKKHLDFEEICLNKTLHYCIISISIAVSNHDTIDVYILPIRIKNLDNNSIKFFVNQTIIEIEENDENWLNKSYILPSAIDIDGNILTYSIYLKNSNKKLNDLFEFDEKNLLLKPLKKFDREEQKSYLLYLIAYNQHKKNLSIEIIIRIKDQNDNQPQCQYNYTKFSIKNMNTKSIFLLNVTDLDENDNGKLEYNIINTLSGFSINHNNGEILFDYSKWIRNNNQSKLFINISDYGKPNRLSTECIVEFEFTFLFDINLKVNSLINIENLHSSIGELKIIDKQLNQTCFNCLININSLYKDLILFNQHTNNIYLNMNSMILIRILSNYLIQQENLSFDINITILDRTNPLIISSKNYSLNFNFNKQKILSNSNILFIKIHENILLNETISIFNQYHNCLNNQLKSFKLIDSTNTFEIDKKLNLNIKKYLNIQQQQYYQVFIKDNQTNQIDQCSIELRIFVYNPYLIANVLPYFFQSFYILTSHNLSSFVLPLLPSYVKYVSSKPNEISINENNGSITIRSLFSSYSYDFYIQAIDSQTPSLTCSIPIRILFGINKQSPRLRNNDTDILLTEFIYQIEAYDPDLLINNQNKIFPPSIEYQIDSSKDLEIDRYTGRIFFKNFNQTKYDFTLILTDFGQPNRFITKQRIKFDIQSNKKIHRQEISMFISRTFILISIGTFFILILFIIIIITCHCKSSTKKSLSNLSPTTPDCRLIDNEYITTTTSLPRVINREQRIYPIISNNDNHRKFLEQIHLPPPSLYSNEKISIKQNNLSINDINKYLERFEKIYNNSSEQYFREPVGSVV